MFTHKTTKLFSDEKPINPKTYRFRYQPKAKPEEQQTIRKLVQIAPEVDERIKRYARRRGCSYSRAIHYLLDTKEAAEMEPPVSIDWAEVARQKQGQYFVSYNLLGLKQPRKQKKNANK